MAARKTGDTMSEADSEFIFLKRKSHICLTSSSRKSEMVLGKKKTVNIQVESSGLKWQDGLGKAKELKEGWG